MDIGEHDDVPGNWGVGYYASVVRTWKGYAASLRRDPRWNGTPRFARTGFHPTEEGAIEELRRLATMLPPSNVVRKLPPDDMGV